MKRYISASSASRVTVYSVTINYQGEITDKTEVARFLNERWAKEFLDACEDWTNAEEGHRFLVKIGDNERLI